MSEVLKTVTHKDIKIEVEFDRGNVRFKPDLGSQWSAGYRSLEEAKEAVDKHVSSLSRIRARALDITHKAVDKDGVPMTIKGINRNDGSVRVSGYAPVSHWGTKVEQKVFSGTVYADRPWVLELLTEYKAAREKLREIEQRLDPVSAKVGSSTYGRKVEISEYEHKMTRMTTDLNTMDKNADKVEATKETA